MKKLLLLIAAASTAVAAAAPIQRGFWKLTPEAQKEIDRLKKTNSYRPMSDRIYFFSRAQLKYGLQLNFLHRWYDRPLHQDSRYNKYNKRRHLLNEKAWPVTVKDVALTGLDGLATSIIKTGRSDILNRVKLPGGKLTVLVELPYAAQYDKGIKSYMEVAEKAINTPEAFRLNGKVVLTRYPSTDDMEFYSKFRAELKKKYGDKFIVMPYGNFLPGKLIPRNNGPLDLKTIEKIKERIRHRLRHTDGFYMSDRSTMWDRRWNPEFFNNVMIPIIHSVYSEPEFKGKKYLGSHLVIAHENTYRFNYTIDCTGTAMLRGNLEAMINMKPDFVIMPEWDEENENTFFRPTVANGLSTQRVCRYYIARHKNEKLTPLKGDNTDMPNLILSYRKNLSIGEEAEFEVLNVPDGTTKDSVVTLVLRGIDGKIVKRFPARKLSGSKCDAAFFTVPASEIHSGFSIRPELHVKYPVKGKTLNMLFKDHFHPLRIYANRNVDYKWAKHCLRDLPLSCTSSMKIANRLPDGRIEMKVKVKSSVPLRSVEIIEDPITSYIYSPAKKLQSDKKDMLLQISMIGFNFPKQRYSGTIEFRNTPSVTFNLPRGDHRRPQPIAKGNVMHYKNVRCDHWLQRHRINISRADIDKGEIHVNLNNGKVKGVLKLKDIAKNGNAAVGMGYGGNLVFTDLHIPFDMPDPFFKKEVEFTAILRPRSDISTFYLMAIDRDFRIHRSKAVTLWKPDKNKRQITVYERGTRKVRKVTVDANRLVEPSYDFKNIAATYPILRSSSGANTDALMGGYASQLAGFGNGECGYGTILSRYINYRDPKIGNTHPTVENGALVFKDANHVSMPIQTVSPFTGFEINMEVYPETIKDRMGLFSMGVNAVEVTSTARNTFVSYFCGDRYHSGGGTVSAKGPALKVKSWNTVKAVFDQKHMWIEVNGKRGPKIKLSGYMLHPRYSVMGATHRKISFFRGKIRKLDIKVR